MSGIKPRVLIVDDHPEGAASSIASELGMLHVDVSHPDDVIDAQLEAVDLLLVDFDLSAWDQQELPVANTCSTGWSLASVLRDRARKFDTRSSAIATAILTSKMDAATMPFTAASRVHIAAELNGIEWVFDKTDRDLARKLTDLAHATLSVQRDWEVADLIKALSLNEDQDLHVEDVLRCRPPVSEGLQWEDGLGILRWMLHRILSYPTFLIDESYLGARLGLATVDLRRLLSGRTKLAKELNNNLYSGILGNFVGSRWWRVGIDSLFWRLSGGRPTDSDLLHSLARKALRVVSSPLPTTKNLVVCYDELLCPLPAPVPADLATRIWPDDWPPYGAQPWATLDDVREFPQLSRLTAPLECS